VLLSTDVIVLLIQLACIKAFTTLYNLIKRLSFYLFHKSSGVYPQVVYLTTFLAKMNRSIIVIMYVTASTPLLSGEYFFVYPVGD
jgi:hypothetical protein